MKRNNTIDCLNAVAEKIQLNPHDYSDADAYVDAVVNHALSRRVWGPLNAAQKSVIKKWARSDYFFETLPD